MPAPTAYAPTASAAADDRPYGPEATLGAVLLSLFMPFIALIAALIIRSTETRPARRQFLKTWAIGSAAWLCTGWLIAIVALTSVSSAAAGCKGGIDTTVIPTYESSDGVHWVGTFTCMNGGTVTKPVPRSQVPGG